MIITLSRGILSMGKCKGHRLHCILGLRIFSKRKMISFNCWGSRMNKPKKISLSNQKWIKSQRKWLKSKMEIWITLTIQEIWLLFQYRRDFIETPRTVWKETSSIQWVRVIKASHRWIKKASGSVRTPKCLMETSKTSMSAKMHSWQSKVRIEKMGRNNMAREPIVHLSQQLISHLKSFVRVIQSEETKTCMKNTIGSTSKIGRRMRSSEN